jgi:hypothetical protein
MKTSDRALALSESAPCWAPEMKSVLGNAPARRKAEGLKG